MNPTIKRSAKHVEKLKETNEGSNTKNEENCEMSNLAWLCLSVRLSVRIEQLSSHCTDFH
jgi:hypothetical protein